MTKLLTSLEYLTGKHLGFSGCYNSVGGSQCIRRGRCNDLLSAHLITPQLTSFLPEFTQTNITGFQKILKKYDKHFRANIVFSSTAAAAAAASSATQLEPLSPTSPIIFDGTPQPTTNGVDHGRVFAHRGSVTAVGKEMWGLVTACKFVRSEDDENLLFRARQVSVRKSARVELWLIRKISRH